MSFATLADYEKLFPGTVSDQQTMTQVAAALAAACEDIKAYCCQQFELSADDTVVLHGTGSPLLLLPQVPVVAVNSVTIDDGLTTEIDVTDFRIDRLAGTLYRPPTFPSLSSPWCAWPSPGWPAGFANITVDYDHGYATVPQNLINVAVQLARNTLAAPPLVFRGERISEYSYTRYENYEGVNEFSAVLDRYRVQRIAAA